MQLLLGLDGGASLISSQLMAVLHGITKYTTTTDGWYGIYQMVVALELEHLIFMDGLVSLTSRSWEAMVVIVRWGCWVVHNNTCFVFF